MWLINEEGDEEFGFTWKIVSLDGETLRTMGECYDEAFAKKVLSALKWDDVVESGMMGIKAKAPARKPKPQPKRIIFTPAKKTK